MEKLVLTINNLSINYGAKDILNINQLSVYENERIGIIGGNGLGKTTLLDVINKGDSSVEKTIDFSYFKQIEELELTNHQIEIDGALLSHFKIPKVNYKNMSGGEKAKFRLSQVLSCYTEGLLLDEPTTHLDYQSIEFLIDELKYYYGTLIVVSHDRYFLNEVATKIWEIENGQIFEYDGNYDDYKLQKNQLILEKERNYQQVLDEKKRLTKTIEKRNQEVNQLAKVSKKQLNRRIQPSRLGGTKQKDTVQKNKQKQIKNMEQRLEKLEKLTPVIPDKEIQFPKIYFEQLHNNFPIMGDNFSLCKGDKLLIEPCDFQFKKGKKIGIVGSNGSGKTSFLEAIVGRKSGIKVSEKTKISVYSQLSYQLTSDLDVLGYLLRESSYQESIIRSVLNKLGFQKNMLKTSVKQLSGGEKTKLSLALTMLKPSNILVLDEPTNFIDINTMVGLESLLKAYQGTVIFTSHDNYFLHRVADDIYEITNKKIKQR